jgi:hypothetical protein
LEASETGEDGVNGPVNWGDGAGIEGDIEGGFAGKAEIFCETSAEGFSELAVAACEANCCRLLEKCNRLYHAICPSSSVCPVTTDWKPRTDCWS